jgi:hypothetical protein
MKSMEIKEFDTVILKDGKQGVVIDIGYSKDGETIYLVEYRLPSEDEEYPEYEQVSVKISQIDEVYP